MSKQYTQEELVKAYNQLDSVIYKDVEKGKKIPLYKRLSLYALEMQIVEHGIPSEPFKDQYNQEQIKDIADKLKTYRGSYSWIPAASYAVEKMIIKPPLTNLYGTKGLHVCPSCRKNVGNERFCGNCRQRITQ